MAIKYLSGITVDSTVLVVDAANDRVGIGTSSPAQKLNVKGSAGNGIALTHSNNNIIAELIEFSGTQGAGLVLKNSSATNNIVLNAGGDSYINGGNVGIGTTAPDSRLHVSGTMRTVLTSGAGGQTLLSAISGVSNGYLINVDASNNITHNWHTGANATSLFISSAGNVGIGTSSPTEKLHVSGGNIIVDSAQAFGFGDRSAQIVGNTGVGGFLRFDTNNAERMRILSSGNVGIGTTAPTRLLSLNTAVNTYMSFNEGGTEKWVIGTDSTDGNQFLIYDSVASSTRMVVKATGNVGIGTSNPAVIGAGNTSFDVAGTAGAGLIARGTTVVGELYASDAGGGVFISAKTNHPIILRTNDVERVRILAGGNVGIGTTSPGYKLEVSGSTLSTEFVFPTSNFNPSAAARSTTNPMSIRMWNNYFNGTGLGYDYGTVLEYYSLSGHVDSQVYFDAAGGSWYRTAPYAANFGGWQKYITSLDISGTTNYVGKFTGANTIGNSSIFDNGSVGIGTTAPLVALDVRGTVIITNPSGSSYNENLRLPQNSSGYATLTLGGAIAASGSDASQWSLLRNPSNSFEIRRQDTVYALINSSGNVGIGTTSPSYKLDVFSGSITSRRGISSPRFSSTGEYNYGVTNSPTWNTNNGSYTNNNATSADGNTTAGTYTLSTSTWDLYQTISATSGVEYTIGVWVKLGTATNFCIVVNNTLNWNTVGGKAFDSSDGLSTSKWTHISYTFTGPATGLINIHIGAHSESGVPQQTAGTVFLWNWEVSVNSSTWIGKVDDEIRLPGSSIWTSRGNVGIGTTAPYLSKLHVMKSESGSAPNAVLRIGNQGAGYTSRIILTDETINDANISYLGATQSLGFGLGASLSQMVLTSAGNVGIGTTSPSARLTVVGDGNFTGTLVISKGASDTIQAGSSLYLQGGSGASYTQLQQGVGRFIIFGFNGSGWVERFTINNTSGNVGIGTTAPNSYLHIAGTSTIKIEMSGGTDQNGMLFNAVGLTNQFYIGAGINLLTGGGAASDRGMLLGYNTTSGKAAVMYDGNGDTRFNVGASNESMRILSGGNVGIGTTSPGALLHVAGVPRFDASGGAPSDTSGTVVNNKYYGNNFVALTSPNEWLKVDINGTAYVIPAYSI
jgi:hypothetical protein